MVPLERPRKKGRGAQLNPPNRFERIQVDEDLDQLAAEDEYVESGPPIRTEYYADDTKTIVTENYSPDVGFRWSVNPYRGCTHGCSYCYARTTHEYFGLSAGLDFESKVFVKQRAPQLLRQWLLRDSWEVEPIIFSGVTDCYQPAERMFQLTRRCLEVALVARQPISIVTKNALVTRDVDILTQMAELNLVHVAVSVTTLDPSLAQVMEPRTSVPAARLRTIRQLRDAGIPTLVMVAPVIAGLNDSEIPSILEAAKEAGAVSAGYILLRLPLTVRPVFLDWLERTQPAGSEKIKSRIRATRGGRLNDSKFGRRMRGTGELADQIGNTFRVFSRRYGLERDLAPLDTGQFCKPRPESGQLQLF